MVAAQPELTWDSRGFLRHIHPATTTHGEPAVAIVSGGGSGHEPLHAGFVGSGLLTAAVPGLMFTSPNAVQITEATRSADNGRGVLHVVKNYTGDVMNFQVARDSLPDIEVDSVLVDDDVATDHPEDDDAPGRRGTAATVLVEKVAGAAARRGDTLADVARVARRMARNSRSMAVALAPGHVPTTGRATFELPQGAMEMGVGIHGERGTDTRPASSATGITEELVDAVSEALGLGSGESVMLLVNGLGATTSLELHLVYGQAITLLSQRGLRLRRGMVGNFVTSVSMAGVSITLARVDEELLALIDAPTSAPAWPRALAVDPRCEPAEPRFPLDLPSEGDINEPFTRFVQRVTSSIDELTELDRQAGDGDFGENMKAALADVAMPLRGSHQQICHGLSRRFLVRAGGTSGAVFGTMLRELAHGSLSAACHAVQDLGGAQPGDRTVVDALAPAADAQAKGLSSQRIAETAAEGAESTTGLVARKGRASYLGERSRGVPDPGALVTSWLIAELAPSLAREASKE